MTGVIFLQLSPLVYEQQVSLNVVDRFLELQ